MRLGPKLAPEQLNDPRRPCTNTVAQPRMKPGRRKAPQLRLKIYRPVYKPDRKDAPSVSGNRLLQQLSGCRQGPSHAVPILGIDFVEAAKLAFDDELRNSFHGVRNIREEPLLLIRRK